MIEVGDKAWHTREGEVIIWKVGACTYGCTSTTTHQDFTCPQEDVTSLSSARISGILPPRNRTPEDKKSTIAELKEELARQKAVHSIGHDHEIDAKIALDRCKDQLRAWRTTAVLWAAGALSFAILQCCG